MNPPPAALSIVDASPTAPASVVNPLTATSGVPRPRKPRRSAVNATASTTPPKMKSDAVATSLLELADELNVNESESPNGDCTSESANGIGDELSLTWRIRKAHAKISVAPSSTARARRLPTKNATASATALARTRGRRRLDWRCRHRR